MSPGTAPFKAVTPGVANRELRRALREIGLVHGGKYVSHDIRRGHAQDLLECDRPLVEILRAGDWRSAAFQKYLDMGYLEAAAVAAAHIGDSSEDDACTGVEAKSSEEQ